MLKHPGHAELGRRVYMAHCKKAPCPDSLVPSLLWSHVRHVAKRMDKILL
jgi:hypothetical protein